MGLHEDIEEIIVRMGQQVELHKKYASLTCNPMGVAVMLDNYVNQIQQVLIKNKRENPIKSKTDDDLLGECEKMLHNYNLCPTNVVAATELLMNAVLILLKERRQTKTGNKNIQISNEEWDHQMGETR